MRDIWGDIERDVDAIRCGPCREACGIVEQHFVATNLDEERWQAGEVGEDRAEIPVRQVVPCGVILCPAAHSGCGHRWLGIGLRRHAGATGCQVCPWRRDIHGRRAGEFGLDDREHHGERKSAARGFAGDDDLPCRDAFIQECPVHRNRVIQGRGYGCSGARAYSTDTARVRDLRASPEAKPADNSAAPMA